MRTRVVEADPGDVAGFRGTDQGQRGGAEGAAAGEVVEVVDGLGEIEFLVVAGGDELENDGAGDLAGLETDLLGFVAVEHLDLVGMVGRAGEGDLGRGAGAVLQGDGDLGHQFAEVAVRILEALGQGRSVLRDRGGEAGQVQEQRLEKLVAVVGDRGVGAAVEIDGQPDQGLLGINIRTHVDGGRNDLHGGLLSAGDGGQDQSYRHG